MAQDETKSVKDWEKERDLIVLGKVDENKQVTETEFIELLRKNDYHPVVHEERIAYLKQNGIDVTRDSMINPYAAQNKTTE